MKWGSTLFPVFVGDSPAWDKIGVMFAFTQFAGTHSYEADCRLIPVCSHCLGRLGERKHISRIKHYRIERIDVNMKLTLSLFTFFTFFHLVYIHTY